MPAAFERQDPYGDRHLVLARELDLLERFPISAQNKAILRQWQAHLQATGAGGQRVAKLSCQFRKLCAHAGKDISALTKDDLIALLALIQQEPHWALATKQDYIIVIKQFFGWYADQDPRLQDGDPEARALYAYLKKHVHRATIRPQIEYAAIITDADLRQVLDKGCRTLRERAFLAVLHESGFRIGEMLNLHVGDLEIKPDRIVASVDGKTGKRRVALVVSVGLLGQWLGAHPFEDQPGAFLWLGDNTRPDLRNLPLRYVGAQKMVKRCFKRAGVTKRCSLHWFRHSRATLNAPYMREAIMTQYFGWTLGSKQVRTYCHLDATQVEDAVLRMHGLEAATSTPLSKKKCLSCQCVNESEQRFCQRCGRALSVPIALEADTERQQDDDRLRYLLEALCEANPAINERYKKYCAAHPLPPGAP